MKITLVSLIFYLTFYAPSVWAADFTIQEDFLEPTPTPIGNISGPRVHEEETEIDVTGENPPVEISLTEVTNLALQNSLDIQIAKYDTYMARTNLGKEKSIFDTVLKAEYNYRRDRTKQPTVFQGRNTKERSWSVGVEKKLPTGTDIEFEMADMRTSTASPFASLNPYHDTSAKVSFTQAIGKNFFGLEDRSKIKITKLDIVNAEYTSLTDIEDTIYQVQAAYWNLVLAEATVEIEEDMLREAKRLSEIYEERYERGIAEKGDVFAVKANERRREKELLKAELERELAKNTLLFLLNEENTEIELETKDPLLVVPYAADTYKELDEAIRNRRDYKKVRNEIESNMIDVKVKKNSLWPEIDLQASFLRNGVDSKHAKPWGEIVSENFHEATAGITFTFPLENRFARADLKEAQYKKAQLLLRLKRTERLILKEISNKVSEVNTYKSQIEIATLIVEAERNKLEEEMRLLGFGKSNSDTIIRFEEDLLMSRLNLAVIYYNYRVALVELELEKNTLLDRYWEGGL